MSKFKVGDVIVYDRHGVYIKAIIRKITNLDNDLTTQYYYDTVDTSFWVAQAAVFDKDSLMYTFAKTQPQGPMTEVLYE